MNVTLSVFLKATTKETCRLLSELLPQVGGDDWWAKTVKAKLSYHQQRRIEDGQIVGMEDLDLAALMRVFDRNWYEITSKTRYPDEARNLVKEVQQIRHRASHEGAGDPPLEDVYRDLDTLQRYLTLVEADQDLLQELDDQRRGILEAMRGGGPPSEPSASPEFPQGAPQPDQAAAPNLTGRPDKVLPERGVPLALLL